MILNVLCSALQLRYRFCDTTIVILHVGEEADSGIFRVHKHLICQASLVFKAHFMGGVIENSKQMMVLPHESKDVVECFVQWLYAKEFELSDDTNAGVAPLRHQQLAELHVFADKYGISELNNLVIDKFFVLGNDCEYPAPPPSVVTYVYNHSTKKSSFRKLVVMLYAFYMTANHYDLSSIRGWLEGNSEFTADLAIVLAQRSYDLPTPDPFFSSEPKDYYAEVKE